VALSYAYVNLDRNEEAEVVHIDQEGDFEITYLAHGLESFILGLGKEADAPSADEGVPQCKQRNR
jgi:hypothetical protein